MQSKGTKSHQLNGDMANNQYESSPGDDKKYKEMNRILDEKLCQSEIIERQFIE